MKRPSYFRMLVNRPSYGEANLRPVHKPLGHIAPAFDVQPSADARTLAEKPAPPTLFANPTTAGKTALAIDPLHPLTRPMSFPATPPVSASTGETSEPRQEASPKRPARRPEPADFTTQRLASALHPEPATNKLREVKGHTALQRPAEVQSTPQPPANPAMAAFVKAALASEFPDALPVPRISTPDGAFPQPPYQERRNVSVTPDSNTRAGSAATPRLPEGASSSQNSAARKEKLERRLSIQADQSKLLTPAVEPQKIRTSLPPARTSENTIQIGTVDIHIAPPPVPQKTAPARIPVPHVTSLARGFQTSVGLRQG